MALKQSRPPALAPSRAARLLCPHCGLCCNGVLFGDVRLQPGDDPQHLAQLGLTLVGEPSRPRFRQPCSCFDGRFCRIYADRPERCRTFVCGLLRRLQTGRISLAEARRITARARQYWTQVLETLRAAGDPAPHLPLSRRVARALAQPLDLADPRAQTTRRQLLLTMGRLAQTLQRYFLSTPSSPRSSTTGSSTRPGQTKPSDRSPSPA
jgi:hypothetical protein